MPSKKRNYRKEYDNYHGTAKQKKNRAARNCTRAIMVKAGKARKGDNMDVDHKIPMAMGGAKCNPKNLRVVAKGTNRSFARTKTARMKKTRNA
jgi:hypothetical protein|tara:strand:+ start:85 stop:363 length:279 start_codon:yes stop_codon:yes gene_type:complete